MILVPTNIISFVFIYFIWVLQPVKIISLIFELSQTEGGAKMADPPEKPPDHPQAEPGSSHMWPELGSNPQWWVDKWFRALKISGHNHSATGAAPSFWVQFK